MKDFTLLKEEPIRELNAQGLLFMHNETKATVLVVKNDAKNKTFGIGFRTPPTDSTGVPHIIEHTVLNGSKKYRVREPFMDLLKVSMQTFLNAMTFSDMTIYPISTMNETDYFNLIDVYLDAVFNPLIYENKNIFYQEGWHHELFKKEDDIVLKGVVYNEMRGAYSSPEDQIYNDIGMELTPTGTYSHESGGYPYDIPNLTYESFLDFHRKNYHPGNSLSFFYGDVDVERCLSKLQEFLKDFKAPTTTISVEPSALPTKKVEKTIPFQGDEESDASKSSYLSFSVNVGDGTNPKERFLWSVLQKALIQSDASPLKRKLLDHKIAEDILPYESGDYHLHFGLVAKNANEKDAARFEELILEALQEIVENGLDKDLSSATLNRLEIEQRELGGTYRGIYAFIHSMYAFRYDQSLFDQLRFYDTLEEVRKEIEEGVLEKLIKERILENPAKILLTHVPKSDHFEKMDQKVREELKAKKDRMSDKEIEELIRLNEELKAFQETEDSEEAKASIPKIDLKDIEPTITPVQMEKESIDGANVLILPMSSGGMDYLTLGFTLKHLSEEELSDVAVLTELLGKLDTENYGFMDLTKALHQATSGLMFQARVLRSEDNFFPVLFVNTKAIHLNLKKMIALVEEVLLRTKLTDKERIKEALLTARSLKTMDFQSSSGVPMMRVNSQFSLAGKVREILQGLSTLDRIEELIEDLSDRALESLESTLKKVFSKENLTAALVTDEEHQEEYKEAFLPLLKALPSFEVKDYSYSFEPNIKQEAITTNGIVQYVSMGGNMKGEGIKHFGSVAVLSNLLDNDYLHNKIRAQGGAYGAGIAIEPDGDLRTYSYRDPNLKETIEAYQKMGEYLKNLPLSEADVKNMILGTITRFDPPLDSSILGDLMVTRTLLGSTKESIEKKLQDALSTTKETIQSYGEEIEKVINEGALVVLGSPSKIESEKALFTDIRPLR
ncbi:insulinase family protein [Guggenheimella bovis]